jgi:hypothetical protein
MEYRVLEILTGVNSDLKYVRKRVAAFSGVQTSYDKVSYGSLKGFAISLSHAK